MVDKKKTIDEALWHTDVPVKTDNEYMILHGKNMDNHSMSMQGLGKFVKIGTERTPTFRTMQEIYRFYAHAIKHAEMVGLPDEDGAHDLDTVVQAIYPPSEE